MKNEKLKQQIIAYALLVLGSALFAVGDVMFVNPYHLAPGGVYGLANVFNALWGWKISVSGIAMDIPLLIIGTIILGPKFGIKTIISVILIPVFTYILETWWGYAPLIHDGAFFDTEMQSSLFFLEGDVQRYFMPDFFLNTIVSGLIYGVAGAMPDGSTGKTTSAAVAGIPVWTHIGRPATAGTNPSAPTRSNPPSSKGT